MQRKQKGFLFNLIDFGSIKKAELENMVNRKHFGFNWVDILFNLDMHLNNGESLALALDKFFSRNSFQFR